MFHYTKKINATSVKEEVSAIRRLFGYSLLSIPNGPDAGKAGDVWLGIGT
jgi:hypothetical protein